MTARGVSTIADLRARSRVDPVTHCWHWLGAVANGGEPRIHTLDYARVEKRIMSGPLAAWNIAHGEAPPPWARFVFRACGTRDCVNPVHLRLARDRAEIGEHQRRAGSRKGTSIEARRANIALALAARGITPTAPDVVRAIRAEGADTTTSALAERLGLSVQTVSRIRRGDTRAGVT